METPDHIAPIVAHRTWRYDAWGLQSLGDLKIWTPGTAIQARCKLFDHEAPSENCTCGIYAAKTYRQLVAMGCAGGGPLDFGVHGEVYLWGRVWEHELGYRAQFAYPKNFLISLSGAAYAIENLKFCVNALSKFRVDVFFAPDQSCEQKLLWSRQFGLNLAALESVADTRGEPHIACPDCETAWQCATRLVQEIRDRRKLLTMYTEQQPKEQVRHEIIAGLNLLKELRTQPHGELCRESLTYRRDRRDIYENGWYEGVLQSELRRHEPIASQAHDSYELCLEEHIHVEWHTQSLVAQCAKCGLARQFQMVSQPALPIFVCDGKTILWYPAGVRIRDLQ